MLTTTKAALALRMKPYIQPFEKKLALSELEALAGGATDQVGDDEFLISLSPRVNVDDLKSRLAYWESIDGAPTVQVLREASVNLVRNGVHLDELRRLAGAKPLLPNRRCLRYATHGIHEYRGKYFPQLVRALLNISGVTAPGSIVGDPMCGSGTTAVEALLSGVTPVAADMNPLSVFMTKVKCAALFVDEVDLYAAYEALRNYLLHVEPPRRNVKTGRSSELSREDQSYLARWFAPEVIRELDVIAGAIEEMPVSPIQGLAWMALSNVLRRVSWQKEDDLRVRKEVREDVELDPIREFLEDLGRSVRMLAAFQVTSGPISKAPFFVEHGDARIVGERWAEDYKGFDAVITSPPYATALPYLDTDRLSLIYLGLLSRKEHRKADAEMIGNREISAGARQEMWSYFCENRRELPGSVVALIDGLHADFEQGDVGFRRKNLPTLLTKYFFDMKKVLVGTMKMLKPGAPAFFVVGDNLTNTSSGPVRIATSELLEEIACSIGFKVESRIDMDMLVSRDIHRRNALKSEAILCFRRPR